MRQLRRGAPLGWLLSLLLPLLVSAGLGGGTPTTTLLPRHTTVVTAAGEHQPLSRQVPPSRQRHTFTTATGFAGTGGGGHPVATRPPDVRYLSLAPGFDWRPAGDDDSRSLAASLVKPGRAPPPTGS